jgi:hypothetical protein
MSLPYENIMAEILIWIWCLSALITCAGYVFNVITRSIYMHDMILTILFPVINTVHAVLTIIGFYEYIKWRIK